MRLGGDLGFKNSPVGHEMSISVLMPVYNQVCFVRRAIRSLKMQTFSNWELIIVNDGSEDDLESFICDYLEDPRIIYVKNRTNKGLGYSLNKGMDLAKNEIIAYLPADDFYYENHLETVANALKDNAVDLVISGIHFDKSKSPGLLEYVDCKGTIPGFSPQLVQVAHRKTSKRWIERTEYVSDDLFFLFWRKLTGSFFFKYTGEITCEWTSHPNQHHKICGEKFGGGLNKYRAYYNVKIPIRYRSSKYKIFDEIANYSTYREQLTAGKRGLKILLVGELAYNPARIHSLELNGHKLFGLWAKPLYGYSTIGHLPFGSIEDIPKERWKDAIAKIRPDIIYAQLSTSAIEIAYDVLCANLGIPFVWHFKEGTHEALKVGLWNKLVTLYSKADGRIFISKEQKEWIEQFIPSVSPESCLIMDGDMPPDNIFENTFSEKLSKFDGEIHTVIAGRMIGISPEDYSYMASNGIHLHVYSENIIPDEDVIAFLRLDSSHLHIHTHVPPQKWTKEFSKYDAGWLHCIDSCNRGSLQKLTWSDMNLPARISTYFVAGIPMIQKKNSGNLFAQKSYLEPYDVDICYDHIAELVELLKDRTLLERKTMNVRSIRHNFSFTNNVPKLIDFFHQIIAMNG